MVRRTKEEAQETRQAILDAAVHVFSENGVSQTSLEQIAEAAGVTRGAVYWHFKNKVDIFEALQQELHKSFMDMILSDLEREHPEPLKQLEELYVRLMQEMANGSERQKIIKIFNLKCDYSGEMAVLLEGQSEKKKKSIELFVLYFERAKQKGHLLPDADTKILALSAYCYLCGICCEHMRNPDMFNLKEKAPLLAAQFFSGVGKK